MRLCKAKGGLPIRNQHWKKRIFRTRAENSQHDGKSGSQFVSRNLGGEIATKYDQNQTVIGESTGIRPKENAIESVKFAVDCVDRSLVLEDYRPNTFGYLLGRRQEVFVTASFGGPRRGLDCSI
jgi:hypothetical protein